MRELHHAREVGRRAEVFEGQRARFVTLGNRRIGHTYNYDMTERQIDTPRLLTTGEAATALRVTSQTIRRRIDDGTIHAVRLGGIVRIPATELDRVIEGTQNKAES
jgi:excisionase family DNA binding protein